ncbi:MAG: hypothetical protein A2Y81_05700 [Nitrospirae bacterium RBG_13_43_8]|nr:MAG: hypothetical protein A2Y81_05700 [Nitrospirae bacterium RBG_13_43_8]
MECYKDYRGIFTCIGESVSRTQSRIKSYADDAISFYFSKTSRFRLDYLYFFNAGFSLGYSIDLISEGKIGQTLFCGGCCSISLALGLLNRKFRGREKLA